MLMLVVGLILILVVLLIIEVSFVIIVVIVLIVTATHGVTHHEGSAVLRITVGRIYIGEAHLGDLVNLFLGILVHVALSHHLLVHK